MSATTAAVPFWRAAGMTYIGYSNVCAALVRRCLKEPHKSEAASREKVHFAISKWADGKQEKPNLGSVESRKDGRSKGNLDVGIGGIESSLKVPGTL
uniref:ATP synthase subunit epsilon, mitochondrial n=1 Tax=Oryza glaberrima TaxID=4538 RepID=I1QGW8_ORYGL